MNLWVVFDCFVTPEKIGRVAWSHRTSADFEMDVSKNSGTPKSSHFNRVFHYKPSIYIHFGIPLFLETPKWVANQHHLVLVCAWHPRNGQMVLATKPPRGDGFSQMMVKSKESVPKKCWKIMLVMEFCAVCSDVRKFLLKAWGNLWWSVAMVVTHQQQGISLPKLPNVNRSHYLQFDSLVPQLYPDFWFNPDFW